MATDQQTKIIWGKVTQSFDAKGNLRILIEQVEPFKFPVEKKKKK